MIFLVHLGMRTCCFYQELYIIHIIFFHNVICTDGGDFHVQQKYYQAVRFSHDLQSHGGEFCVGSPVLFSKVAQY